MLREREREREREEVKVGVEAAEIRDGEEINEIKSELPGDLYLVEKAEKDWVKSTTRLKKMKNRDCRIGITLSSSKPNDSMTDNSKCT